MECVMNEITFPIRPQMQNRSVADLHEALTFLGFAIRDAEKTRQRFGASTRAAVIEFQAAHELEGTGLVDEETASTLNGVLADRDAFDAGPGGGVDLPTPDLASDDTLFSVQGEVVKPDGTPMANQVVRAYDRALCEWRPLGNADATIRTNDLGRYRISLRIPRQVCH
jgi:hypothetical protein